jgi:hypothetical protein
LEIRSTRELRLNKALEMDLNPIQLVYLEELSLDPKTDTKSVCVHKGKTKHIDRDTM